MPQPSIRYIEDLSFKDTETLTKLLSLGWRTKPTLQWQSEQEQAISQLPSSLRRSKNVVSKVVMSLPRSPQKAVLCQAHKGLNPLLIHRLFFQLSAECTTRLARLDENPHLPPNLAAFLRRMHAINSLWFSADMYRHLFRLPYDEKCYEMVGGGCEACILAIVGSSQEMLCDLRASMLGRRKKGLPVPRLLKVVSAWVEESPDGIAIRQESDVLEKEIRECRRQMQKARRQVRRNVRDGIVDNSVPEEKQPLMKEPYGEAEPEDIFEMDGKEKDECAEHYFEGSILDYYAGGLKSSTNLGSQTRAPTPVPEDIHPAFRESMLSFDANTGTFSPRGNPPSPPPKSAACGTWSTWTTDVPSSQPPSRKPSPPPRPTTAYTASVYSRNQFGDPVVAPSSIPDVPSIPDTFAAEQEKTYRKLMGIEEEGDEESERQSRNSRVSKWMDDQRR